MTNNGLYLTPGAYFTKKVYYIYDFSVLYYYI